ncbi:hypothetical protein SCHIN_v1c06060 [Spiroplasma chinense]|uniref:Uncharacterized protein n=1 Tax=Spiroplasma chinense TaxID=216932 RepID=A0A5B9Y4U7_9MOLU|nr:hypothetical protein [Spiroplasma chinense]QEH61803.1 hypothetical protein SCHIN_v1c06060 [Spiroplasma chinense]
MHKDRFKFESEVNFQKDFGVVKIIPNTEHFAPIKGSYDLDWVYLNQDVSEGERPDKDTISGKFEIVINKYFANKQVKEEDVLYTEYLAVEEVRDEGNKFMQNATGNEIPESLNTLAIVKREVIADDDNNTLDTLRYTYRESKYANEAQNKFEWGNDIVFTVNFYLIKK